MKFTTKKDFKSLVSDHFMRKLESVDRANRGEEDDYPEEDEGAGTTYESVDRARRGEEDDYPEEDEGAGTVYETNLYSDSDLEKTAGREDIAHGEDAEQDTHDEEEETLGEGNRMPSLKMVFQEGSVDLDTGWEKTISKLATKTDPESHDVSWNKAGAGDQ